MSNSPKKLKSASKTKSSPTGSTNKKKIAPNQLPVFPDFSEAFDKMLVDLRQQYETLDEDTRIAAASVIIPAVLEHAREGGSYRYLIYERLGFSEASYVPLQLAGVLDASNDLVASNIPAPQNIASIVALLNAYAQTLPMEDSGIKDVKGNPIMFPSQQRRDCFDAVEAVQTMVHSLYSLKSALKKATAESPSVPPTPSEQLAGEKLLTSLPVKPSHPQP